MFLKKRDIICVPYRNRPEQLMTFLNDSSPLFKKILPNSRVIIVEQSQNKPFNRGKLLNIGFMEKYRQMRYFFTHDVDINPTDKCVKEFYTRDVSDSDVLGIYTSVWDTLGGIIKLRRDTYKKLNGFPNDYWGWGVEDKAFQNRADFFNISKQTCLLNDKPHDDYIKRFDDTQDRVKIHLDKKSNFHYNVFQHLTRENQQKSIETSGLNNLEYSILYEKKIVDHVHHMIVDI